MAMFVKCIESMQLEDIRKTNMKNKSANVSKFISLFFEDNGDIKNNKINDRYNRDYFAWGIKELMVNDIVLAIRKRVGDDSIIHYDVANKNRIIIKNVLFESVGKKVKINFYDESVKAVSKQITEFGKNLISSKEINKFDSEGCKNINKAFECLEKNKEVFVYQCRGTLLTVFSKERLIIKDKDNLHKYNTYEEIKSDIDYISGAVFDCAKNLNKEIVFEHKNQNEIKEIFYSSIIKCLARMTDKYIKDLVKRDIKEN